MKRTTLALCLFAVVAMLGAAPNTPESHKPFAATKPVLTQTFDLAAQRSPGTRYYEMKTTFTSYDLNGQAGESESYCMKLKCVSPPDAADKGDQYACGGFTYTKPNGDELAIPSLKGWNYAFKQTMTGLDEKGQVLGIDHKKFDKLTTSDGSELSSEKAYFVYNTFIDFHAFCDDFAAPTLEGQGIQHLKKLGDKIVHAAAHSKPPVNLGNDVKPGSYFQNGEITLALKGIGLVDEKSCAIVAFDSGDSTFKMIVQPMPQMEVKTTGGSHYFGDIYVDLETRCPARVEMNEVVISETQIPMPGAEKPMLTHTLHKRRSTIRMISKEAFDKD